MWTPRQNKLAHLSVKINNKNINTKIQQIDGHKIKRERNWGAIGDASDRQTDKQQINKPLKTLLDYIWNVSDKHEYKQTLKDPSIL